MKKIFILLGTLLFLAATLTAVAYWLKRKGLLNFSLDSREKPFTRSYADTAKTDIQA